MATWIVFRREISSYLTSPFAYVIAAAVLLLMGILFNRDLALSISTKAPDAAIVPTAFSFTLIFFAPLLTMRLLAEEKREGTLELLLTAPVPDSSIVIGKFFGAWAYLTGLLLITLTYQIVLIGIAQPDVGITVSSYLGIWLYAGATLSIGILCSALTENQIVAAFVSMITLFILWISDQAGQVITNIDIARIIRTISLQGHFSTSFAVGLLRAEDVAFFAGIMAIALFAAIRAVEAQRMR